MLQYAFVPDYVAYIAAAAVALTAAISALRSCVRRYRAKVLTPTCGLRSSEPVEGGAKKEIVCDARKANEEDSGGATSCINPILCEQPSTGAQLRRRLRQQEQNYEPYPLPSDRHLPQRSVPLVATHVSVDDAMQTHLQSGDAGDLKSSSGSLQQSENPAKGVVEVHPTSQKHPSFGPDAVASCVQSQEADTHKPPPFDDEVMTAFCPFGFGGKNARLYDEDDSGAFACPMAPASSYSRRCPIESSEGAGLHRVLPTGASDRACQNSDSSCCDSGGSDAASSSSTECRAQWFTATPSKEALRSIPEQLSDSEKEAEAAACQAQLSAILELMRKQDDVFSMEDIEGVSSQLKLYM